MAPSLTERRCALGGNSEGVSIPQSTKHATPSAPVWFGTCPDCGGRAVFRMSEDRITGACCESGPCWWAEADVNTEVAARIESAELA